MLNPPVNRLAYLDALRGIAAMSVCVYHAVGSIGVNGMAATSLPDEIKNVVMNGFDLGRFGVVLFFLISGFIIPASLKPGQTLLRFVVTRFFRLYPAYWLACFLILFLPISVHTASHEIINVLANLTMVPRLFHEPELSGVFWTLFVEILFYFTCASLFKLGLLEKPVIVGLVAICLNLAVPLAILCNTFFYTKLPLLFLCHHLSFLFVGSVLRLDLLKGDRQARIFSILLLVLTLVTVPVITGLLFPVPQIVASRFVMYSAGATTAAYYLAIASFLLVTWNRAIISSLFLHLGKVSYSLYLLHMLCITGVVSLLSPSTLGGMVLHVMLSLTLSLLAANAAYHLVEKPAMVLGRRIVQTYK